MKNSTNKTPKQQCIEAIEQQHNALNEFLKGLELLKTRVQPLQEPEIVASIEQAKETVTMYQATCSEVRVTIAEHWPPPADHVS